MSSSECNSESEVEPERFIFGENHSIKTTYLLHKCQLDQEIEKLERMIRETEKQKDIVEMLRNTSRMLKSMI